MPESIISEIRISIPLLIDDIKFIEKFRKPIRKAENIHLAIIERIRWLKSKIFINKLTMEEIINTKNLCFLFNFVKFVRPIIQSKLSYFNKLLPEGMRVFSRFGITELNNNKKLKINIEDIKNWKGNECLNENEQKNAFEGQRLYFKVLFFFF
ncbi:hypothetical protein Mgra_00001503 [Meloidogyne graminicola]|uniref:Uncharacterized protein n=1 Tax=Meloidogyne graminicola TaxID=189291 RepID=A0A8S9ZZB1_9BILA|nr:hypothetical protein Mgra_00001503 [Meloidogyne graminicola]